jgi:hypothetical protein
MAMLSLLFAFRRHLNKKLQRQCLGALFSMLYPLFRFARKTYSKVAPSLAYCAVISRPSYVATIVFQIRAEPLFPDTCLRAGSLDPASDDTTSRADGSSPWLVGPSASASGAG